MPSPSYRRHLTCLGACVLLGACVTPRYVTSIASREGRVRFFYRSAYRTGLIECRTTSSGDLIGCVDRPIIFKD